MLYISTRQDFVTCARHPQTPQGGPQMLASTLGLRPGRTHPPHSSQIMPGHFKRPCVILDGPPGGGKGTQGLRMRLDYPDHIEHISTGDRLRALQAEPEIMAAGGLVPDDQINKKVRDWYRQGIMKQKTVILDGFPRTLDQATYLLQEIVNPSEVIVFEFKATRELCLERMLNRKKNALPGEERPDDDPEKFHTRFDTYEKNRDAIMSVFKQYEEQPNRAGCRIFPIECREDSNTIFNIILRAMTAA